MRFFRKGLLTLLAEVRECLLCFRNRRAYLGSDAAAQNMGGSLTDVPQSLFARDETPEHPVLTPLDTSHASIPAHNESPFSTSNATTSRGRDRSTAKHGQSVLEGLERTGSGSGNRSNPGVGERVSRRSSGDASGRGSGELGTLAQEAAPSTLKAPRTPGSRGENAVQPSPNLAQNRDLPPGFGISSKRTNPSTSADTPQKGGRSSKATGKVLSGKFDRVYSNLMLWVWGLMISRFSFAITQETVHNLQQVYAVVHKE